MFCAWCVKFKDSITEKKVSKIPSHNFVTGSTNFKKSAVKDHEDAPSHKKAASLMKAEEEKPEESSAGRALLALKEKDRARLSILFRNAHALAKQNRPFSDYE